jgi:hypothetical protein
LLHNFTFISNGTLAFAWHSCRLSLPLRLV